MTRTLSWLGALLLLSVAVLALIHFSHGPSAVGAIGDDDLPGALVGQDLRELQGAGASSPERLASTTEESAAPDVLEAGAQTTEAGDFVAVDVYGRVLSQSDEPIPGARIVLFAGRGRNLGPALAETESDAAGRFRMPDVGEYKSFVVHAEREGFFPVLCRGAASGVDVQVRLRSAHAIRGRVLDAQTGAAVPGAHVFMRLDYWNDAGYQGRQVVTSDSRGDYVLNWMRLEGDVTIWAQREGEGPEPFQFQLEANQRDGHDLELGSTRKFVLEFIDFTSEAPLPHLPITLDWHVTIATDGSGLLELPFPSVTMRRYGTLVLQADGYCSTHLSLESGHDRIRIPMLAAARVDGLVLDPDGAPCAGAKILFEGATYRRPVEGRDESLTLAAAWRPIITGDDGRFRAPGRIPQKESIRVRASQTGYLDSDPVEISLSDSGSQAEVQLQLRRGSTLSGTVRLNGTPQSQTLSWSCGALHGQGRSNARGNYRLTGLPQGVLTISTVGESEWLRLEVEVAAEQVQQDLDFVYRQGRIEGTLLDADGNPAVGVKVTALERHPFLEHAGDARTGTDGAFAISLVVEDDGRFEIHAGEGAARTVERDVPAGTSGLRLQLVPVAELKLEIRDGATQRALPRCDIWWREFGSEQLVPVNGHGRGVAPERDGRYSIVVPQGRIDLVFEALDEGYGRTQLTGLQITDGPGAGLLSVPMTAVPDDD